MRNSRAPLQFTTTTEVHGTIIALEKSPRKLVVQVYATPNALWRLLLFSVAQVRPREAARPAEDVLEMFGQGLLRMYKMVRSYNCNPYNTFSYTKWESHVLSRFHTSTCMPKN